MRYEYCEKDIGEMEDRLHAIETRREAIERFNPPVGPAKVVTPDDCYWHELLTSAASLLEEIAGRNVHDDQTQALANLYREQAAGFSSCSKFPPVKFVRGG